MKTIKCRAAVHDDCYDGKPISEVYDDGGPEDDGTWDGESVICDPCYLRILPFAKADEHGREDLASALAHYRSNEKFAREHPAPATLVKEAEENARRATPGSPYHASATACAAMARREVERRTAETEAPA